MMYKDDKNARSKKMNTKTFKVKYKDADSGIIEGYASTWDREPDSYGDIVAKGAFEKSLRDRWNGGKNIPLLWAHQMDDLKSYIGKADADEDDRGLHFVAHFDATPEAQKVREMYKDGRLDSFSFAYDTKDAQVITIDGVDALELRELDIFEISCVLVPANSNATVTDVKAGRRNSKADADKLEQAITLIRDVLGQLDDTNDPDDEEDESKAKAAAEEQSSSNSETAEFEKRYNDITNYIKEKMTNYIKEK